MIGSVLILLFVVAADMSPINSNGHIEIGLSFKSHVFFFFFFFFFNSVLRPFQDYFSSYETGQSVGGVKTGEPREKPPDTPASRTWLVSHVARAGLELKSHVKCWRKSLWITPI